MRALTEFGQQDVPMRDGRFARKRLFQQVH